jgi:molybdopterin converting factor small subunit
LNKDDNKYVKVRLYAAARASVGASEVLCSPASAQEILDELAAGESKIISLFSRCSVLLQGEQLHNREQFIEGGSEMDILPPFAGGAS